MTFGQVSFGLLKLRCANADLMLLGHNIPYDGEPREELVTVMVPVTAIFIVLSISGIIYAVICFMFNAIFHKKR